MFRLLTDSGGLGLAAPQVGIDARFFITTWGEVFVDPVFVYATHPITIVENCLSLPGKSYMKHRWSLIELGDGRVYNGLDAVVIQHEMDHLNGRLLCD